MAWNFSNPFSVPKLPAPSARESGTPSQPGAAGSMDAMSVNPHPSWFNHAIVNDGTHVPTLPIFKGMGSYQAGRDMTGSGFHPMNSVFRGATPVSGQV
jgi:hypothetical protein